MPIINFSHQKGGVGKSLLSYHLAYLLKDNYDVQLLDLDYQKSLSSIHKTTQSLTSTNFLFPIQKLFPQVKPEFIRSFYLICFGDPFQYLHYPESGRL